MKDLFTKLGESITSTVKEVGEQTQKSLDQTVYRTELLTLKNELKKLYAQLGERRYEAYINGTENRQESSICNQITALLKEITQKESYVKNIVGTQKDSFDSYKRDVKTTWNDNMAQEMKPEKNEQGIDIIKVCEKCNTGNHVGAAYCIYCGNKF